MKRIGNDINIDIRKRGINMEKFYKTNLLWVIDYDYDRSGCTCDEDICRCTTIEDRWINNIDVNQVKSKLYNQHKTQNSIINEYCFDRICHIFKIYDKDCYEIEVVNGYYGEEIEGIWFNNEEEVFNAYNKLCQLDSDIEKIKYCLELEYGYLIDSVKSAVKMKLIDVSPNEIYLPQMEYFKRIDKDVVDAYKRTALPIGVCVKNDNHYKLIDGYHRFVATKDREKVLIIVLE
jgi:hypothetical protein